MKLFAAAAVLACAVAADEYTVERDSRTADITGLTTINTYTGTEDKKRYENYIKWEIATDAADSADAAI